jgi:hypothetical protein
LIKTSYTPRLFFGKYNTKITLCTVIANKKPAKWRPHRKPKELQNLRRWCSDNFESSDYIIKDRWVSDVDSTRYNQMCYLSSSVDKQQLLKQFGSTVVEVTQPFDQAHNSQLDVRNITVVRDTLLFSKYQYCVYFKYDPEQHTYRWLRDFLHDEQGVKLVPDPSREYSYAVWPRVYLEDSTHLTTFKLMWQEKIDYVKTVHLTGNTTAP